MNLGQANSAKLGGPNSVNFGAPNSMNLGGPNSASFANPNSANLGARNPTNVAAPKSQNLGGANSMNIGQRGVSASVNPNGTNSANQHQRHSMNLDVANSANMAQGAPGHAHDAHADGGHAQNHASKASATGHGSSHASNAAPPEGAAHKQLKGLADSLLGSDSPKLTVDPQIMPQPIERRNIFKENPNVYYLNGESLSRPLTVPPDIKKKRWIFVLLAMIIAALMLFFYFDQILSAPARAQEQMQEALAQDMPTNPPDLLKMLNRSDKKIKSSLEAVAKKGDYSILDLSDKKASPTEMDLVKIPSTLSEEEGAEYYENGLNKLNALQLVTLLHGGWDLNVDRTSGLNISLHYADFKSTSPKTAIAQAIAAEGLSRGKTTESGDDDGFGNAYSSGSIMIKNVGYTWTVSSTYLKDVYSTSGVPENATYVGVRIIKNAY